MSPMTRRGLIIGCLCIVLSSLGVVAAQAAAPEGPRLAITALSLESFGATLFTAGADGTQPRTVLRSSARHGHLNGVLPSGPVAWSPDGQTLVFAGTVGVRRTSRSSSARTMLFAVAAEGGKPRALPGTADAEDPVFSPDGHTIAFARQRLEAHLHHPSDSGSLLFVGASTWLTDIGGGTARQITPWKNGLANTPSSFSPDGLTLALTRAAGRGGSEAVGLRLDSGAETVLARNAAEAVYSPDGSRIALLRTPAPQHASGARSTGSELVVIQADGSGEVRLMAASQGTAVSPRWDPSGQRIAFVKLKRNETLEALLTEGDSIFEVNADGTCPTRAFAAPHVLYASAVWQPGPGREASPLSC